jgi:hypothetical protein
VTGLDRFSNLFDELVIHAGIGQRATHGTAGRADG